jgi:hypothetical protein
MSTAHTRHNDDDDPGCCDSTCGRKRTCASIVVECPGRGSTGSFSPPTSFASSTSAGHKRRHHHGKEKIAPSETSLLNNVRRTIETQWLAPTSLNSVTPEPGKRRAVRRPWQWIDAKLEGNNSVERSSAAW